VTNNTAKDIKAIARTYKDRFDTTFSIFIPFQKTDYILHILRRL